MPAHRPDDPSRRPPVIPRQKSAPTRRPEAPAREPAGRSREAPGQPREPEVSGRQTVDLAHRIADAVLRCPDVADLSGGPFGTVATYLPGERFPGVALREDEVEVSVVVRLGRPIPEIANAVRAAVAPMVGNRRVNVHIGGLT